MTSDPVAAPPERKGGRFRPLPEWAGRATRLVHGGELPDLNAGAVVGPMYLTSTYRFPEEFSEAAERGDVYLYSRERNPTVEAAAEAVRQLEGGGAAELFASGMGAISATVLSLVRSGDEVVAPDVLYGGTHTVLRDLLPRLGVTVRFLNEAEAADPSRSMTTRTRLALLETPTNPVLRVHEIRAWAEAVHRVGGVLAVDNTFASPINQRPLALGADLSIHSATKYLGGHSDLSAGALVGAPDLLQRIDARHLLGAPLDPFAAFLLRRSLKTLDVRVAQHNRNAEEIVRALDGDAAIARIHYPGRYSPRDEQVAAAQMSGRGGMLALSLRGGAPAVRPFLHALRIVQVASSLGGVESLVSVPSETSHRSYSDEERRSRGIDDGLVRLSVGIEDAGDLVRDLRGALEAARSGNPTGSSARN